MFLVLKTSVLCVRKRIPKRPSFLSFLPSFFFARQDFWELCGTLLTPGTIFLLYLTGNRNNSKIWQARMLPPDTREGKLQRRYKFGFAITLECIPIGWYKQRNRIYHWCLLEDMDLTMFAIKNVSYQGSVNLTRISRGCDRSTSTCRYVHCEERKSKCF